MSIVRAMINYSIGLLLREATLTLSDGVAIWGAATPVRDDNSGDESLGSPLAQPLYLQS
jgi:hypothetical protein